MENEQNNLGNVIHQIRGYAVEATPWLKFIGVMSIIYGALMCLTIVGILVAWLPIWMGILLFQAGNAAKDSQVMDNPVLLVDMMKKLKTFFIINGVLLILGIIFIIFWFIFMGAALMSLLGGGNNYYGY